MLKGEWTVVGIVIASRLHGLLGALTVLKQVDFSMYTDVFSLGLELGPSKESNVPGVK